MLLKSVHTHTGILLSYKKEYIWVSYEVDETITYYTEWNKSERERQIPYINAYVWSLERWYWWSYMQGSKGDTDIKNRLLDSVGEGEGRLLWENSIETYKLPYVNQITSESLVYEAEHPKPVLCKNLQGGVGGKRVAGGWGWGRHMYISGWVMLVYGPSYMNNGGDHHNIVK